MKSAGSVRVQRGTAVLRFARGIRRDRERLAVENRGCHDYGLLSLDTLVFPHTKLVVGMSTSVCV